jgi:hypothetical protein
MVKEMELFESPDITPLDFCLCGWMKREVNKVKVDTAAAAELVAHILDAAGCIQKRDDQLSRTTRDLRTRVAECTEVDCGISGTFIVNCDRFIVNCDRFIVNCDRFVMAVSQICNLRVNKQLKSKSRATNFCFFNAIHKAFVFVDTNSSVSVTIQN